MINVFLSFGGRGHGGTVRRQRYGFKKRAASAGRAATGESFHCVKVNPLNSHRGAAAALHVSQQDLYGELCISFFQDDNAVLSSFLKHSWWSCHPSVLFPAFQWSKQAMWPFPCCCCVRNVRPCATVCVKMYWTFCNTLRSMVLFDLRLILRRTCFWTRNVTSSLSLHSSPGAGCVKICRVNLSLPSRSHRHGRKPSERPRPRRCNTNVRTQMCIFTCVTHTGSVQAHAAVVNIYR